MITRSRTLKKNINDIMFEAINNGDIEGLKRAFEEEANVYAEDKNGNQPLHIAVKNGNLKIAELLTDEYGADVDEKNAEGKSPLHLAVEQYDMEMSSLLLELLGADVDVRDRNGETPLYYALRNGDLDIIKLLVEDYDADLNIENIYGHTPFNIAFEKNNVQAIGIISNMGGNVMIDAKISPLTYVLMSDNNIKYEIAKEILKYSDVNEVVDGLTALDNLESVGLKNEVDFLVQNGASKF